MPRIPTLTNQIPRDAEKAILAINAAVDQARAQAARVQAALSNPGPLTAAQLAQVRNALQVSGSAPLDISFLLGGSTLGLIPIQGPRTALPTSGKPGQFFFANDLVALYIAKATGQFQFVCGSLIGDSAGRPGGLSGVDEGYVYFQQEGPHSNISVWSGATWRYIVGYLSGTLGSIPVPAPQWDGSEYYATDFDRVYLCVGGTAWQDAPGQPKRKGITFFDAPPSPGTGWALCNGGTVTISTPTGGTASYTTRNLVGSNLFIRSNSSSGGTGGLASSVTLGENEPDQTVQSGVGATVPAAPHTHNVPTVPPYMDFVPYVRL
jgi:hypothetical protein